MAKSENSTLQYDPLLERVAVEEETTSDRLRAKLQDRTRWCFCELCWRPTEYSATLEAPKVVKKLARGNTKDVPLTPAIRAAAQRRADKVVERYEKACQGHFGPYEAGRMWLAYCDPEEMRGDRSVFGFRDHVERRMLLTEWARHGELVRASRLPGHAEGSAKPSKLYCEHHNPRRSAEARRAYKRDHDRIADFEFLIDEVYYEAVRQGFAKHWDIEYHADIRKKAYHILQASKAPTRLIDELLAEEGPMSQADIARRLGISRQAVSAALKRRGQKGSKKTETL